MFSFESLVFLLSSVIVVIWSYFKIPTNISQIVVAALLIIIVIFSSRFLLISTAENRNKHFRYLLLLLISLFVQFLINTTGGFLSPFLILLHISYLGISFLLSLPLALVFLFFSLATISVNVMLNQNLSTLLLGDPGAVILYIISFVVIIPTSQFLTYNYHLKDVLFRVLKESILIKERREEMITGSLSELILVTDNNFNIQSFNETVEKTLRLSQGDILNHPILEVLPLQDKEGHRPNMQQLSMENIFANKVSTTISTLYLQTISKTQPEPVIIRIRPITDSLGQIRQLVFIITDAALSHLQKHLNIDQAHTRRQMLIQNIRDTIIKSQPKSTSIGVELLAKTDEDILTAFEIEDHAIKESVSLQDIAWISQQTVAASQQFAASLDVSVEFSIPEEEAAEKELLHFLSTDYPRESLPISDFTALVDKNWFKIAINKFLDLAILLASGETKRVVKVSVSQVHVTSLRIVITTPTPPLSTQDQKDLFAEYYGNLGINSNLRFGSGLEGFIAKTITTQLNIPLEVKYLGNPSELAFILTLSRLPHPS